MVAEAVGEWFEEDKPSPFMMQVLSDSGRKAGANSRRRARRWLRPSETVYRDTNPRYHRLIEYFRELTGVPMLLNTSFNENEPVVCDPRKHSSALCTPKMDALAIGDVVMLRR
jgi:carbamoyltransferase